MSLILTFFQIFHSCNGTLKAAIINISVLSMDKMTSCVVKGVTCGEELREVSHYLILLALLLARRFGFM